MGNFFLILISPCYYDGIILVECISQKLCSHYWTKYNYKRFWLDHLPCKDDTISLYSKTILSPHHFISNFDSWSRTLLLTSVSIRMYINDPCKDQYYKKKKLGITSFVCSHGNPKLVLYVSRFCLVTRLFKTVY